MTSITQLLSPWPITSKHSIVLQNPHQMQSNSSPEPRVESIHHHHAPPAAPSSPNDSMAQHPDSDGADGNSDGRKGYGKRELSTSKRAAQNRAAQRAFRQRKEGYIKKLEEQVRDYQALSENYKAVQAENYQLRDYIINLQSRLLESQGEVPPPPSNVDGLQPGKANQPSHPNTLPRLSELGAVGSSSDTLPSLQDNKRVAYPDPSMGDPSLAKRMRPSSSEMTPSQAALQGPAILSQSPPGAR